MATVRLNMTHRQVLRDFATKNVECRAEQKARDKAYAKAAKLVRDAVEKAFPPADMAILAKYETAGPDRCIHGGSPSGEYLTFNFDATDTGPICPSRYCSSRSLQFSQTASDAIAAFELATHALKKAKDEKLTAYKALITSARTFDEIVDVWPAAAALADRIGQPSTALVALSDDVRRFIQTDNAGAQLAQAA